VWAKPWKGLRHQYQLVWVLTAAAGVAGGAADRAVAGHRGAGEYARGAGGVPGVLGGAGGDPAAVVVAPPDGVPAAPGPVAPTVRGVRGVRGAVAANGGTGPDTARSLGKLFAISCRASDKNVLCRRINHAILPMHRDSLKYHIKVLSSGPVALAGRWGVLGASYAPGGPGRIGAQMARVTWEPGHRVFVRAVTAHRLWTTAHVG